MELVVATTFRQRLLGLALRRRAPPDRALLIPRCRSVHTFGMRFALDLVWLDAAGEVLAVDAAVPPWRVRTRRDAAAVIEVPAGAGARVVRDLARRSGGRLAIRWGERLAIRSGGRLAIRSGGRHATRLREPLPSRSDRREPLRVHLTARHAELVQRVQGRVDQRG